LVRESCGEHEWEEENRNSPETQRQTEREYEIVRWVDAKLLADARKDKRRIVGELEVAHHVRRRYRRALAEQNPVSPVTRDPE
jgi:hypothetical protein